MSTYNYICRSKTLPCSAGDRCPAHKGRTQALSAAVDRQDFNTFEKLKTAAPVTQRQSFFADEKTMAVRDAAQNTSTEVDELRKLSKSKSAIARINVARNESSPQDLLVKLSKDKDWGVRAAVAKNPATSNETMKVLSGDSEMWVRDAVKDSGRRF